MPLISEVFYDGVGSDNGQSFVELYGAPGTPHAAGSSIARLFAYVDSDDNAFDFAVLVSPTPGTAPLSVPEPSTGLLAFTPLAVLAVNERRSDRERSLRPAGELDRLLRIERPPEADASVN